MSMGPLGGILGSAAGSPLSQTHGASTERAKQDANATERLAEADQKSERAAGVGETEEDSGASDRDADGRRLWEQQKQPTTEDENSDEATPPPPTNDQTGGQLDLLG